MSRIQIPIAFALLVLLPLSSSALDCAGYEESTHIVAEVATLGDAYGIDVAGNTAYVADGNLAVVDITIPSEPVFIGSAATAGSSRDVVVAGGYAYVADYTEGMQIFDLFSLNIPVWVGGVDTPGYAFGIAVQGDYVYLADCDHPYEDSGLVVIDVSDPAAPVIMGTADIPGGRALNVVVRESLAYVASDNAGLNIIDVSDPENPVIIGNVDTKSWAEGVDVEGDYAYVIDTAAGEKPRGLYVIDVSDPENPVISGTVGIDGADVEVVGDIAYVSGDWLGLLFVDVSDPAAPVVASYLDTPGYARDVFIDADHAYVADHHGGLQIALLSPDSFIAASLVMGGRPLGIEIVDDHAYVANQSLGILTVDLSDPENPSVVGGLDSPGSESCIDVSGEYAYVGEYYSSTESRLLVIDPSDPVNPILVGAEDVTGRARGIACSGDIACVAADDEGLHVVDVSDGANPLYLESVAIPDEAWDVAIAGDLAYVAAWESGLQVVDISSSPALIIGAVDTPHRARGVCLVGARAYVADDESGLQIVDISDPENPALIGGLDTPDEARDVSVAGAFAYVADFYGGLHVVDVSDPLAPALQGTVSIDRDAGRVAANGDLVCVGAWGQGFHVLAAQCSDVTSVPSVPMAGMALRCNYPNPFNPKTTIGFFLPEDSSVRLSVYDPRGRFLRLLLDGRYPAGEHSIVWNGRDAAGRQLASGVYLARLEAAGELRSEKLVLSK